MVNSWLLEDSASGMIRQAEDLTDAISFLRKGAKISESKDICGLGDLSGAL